MALTKSMGFKITYGGWYQRTTLHLTEVYDLFTRGYSKLALDPGKLKKFHELLALKEISREAGNLEFIWAKTAHGIEIRYFEDGLYILELRSGDIRHGQKILENYFASAFNPAIAYIFSLGAPTPKVLANIQTAHPTVVSVAAENPARFEVPGEFGPVYGVITARDVTVYKTPGYIFVASLPKPDLPVSQLVEMQIFFREFKDQLEKYLNIHRTAWEEISAIKERRAIKGQEVDALRSRLDGYQKTISLITNRINQMGTYIHTRSSIAKALRIDEDLITLFQFKFEALRDTLDYIKELWKMTSDYLSSAIQNLVEIKSQATNRSIQSLQVIASLGVVSAIIGYLSKNEVPRVTAIGALYFVVIVAAAWAVNRVITVLYRNKKYKLKFGDRAEDL